ncbi:hypothetical protein [Nocardia niigatensis]
MPEPAMYSLTTHPTYRQRLSTFDELRRFVDRLPESLNFVVSWRFRTEGDDYYDGVSKFSVLVFMARTSAMTQYTTTEFDRAEVEAWLAGPIRERTMRWYGWNTEAAANA